jgi:hypothetical protein
MPLSGSGSGSYFYPTMQIARNAAVLPPVTFTSSATFVGDAYSVVFGPVDTSRWYDFAITLTNNSVNNLKSGSVEASYDGTNWTVVNSTFFSPLTSSGTSTLVISRLFTASLYPSMRVRAWASGSGGGISGSVGVVFLAR